jgi:hypothetical protein
LGQDDSHVKVLRLGLGESIDTGNVVLNLKRHLANETLAIRSHVEITNVWTGTICVDLVNSDLDRAALGDLSDRSCGQGILSLLADIDVAFKLSTTALIDEVGLDLSSPDQSGILLAWVDSRAIPGNSRVD